MKQFVLVQPWTGIESNAVTTRADTVPQTGETSIVYSSKSLSPQRGGIDRIGEYEFTHPNLPEAFDGFRIAFISDTHYVSLFSQKELTTLASVINDQKADVLLMGGDYQEGCEHVVPLFEALAEVKTPMGTYGVLGNNDYERCHDDIIQVMKSHGMHPLEHQMDTLRRNGQQIILAGIRNPFDLNANGVSPTLSLQSTDFVVMLVHTPDYAEDVSIANTDLVLAGHTHGGQVVILGYAPIVPSHYGSRFLTGLKTTTQGVPMIVTNGIGTSNANFRMGAPTEVVVITLRRRK